MNTSKFPNEKELNDFLKNGEYNYMIGKKVSLCNNPPIPDFTITKIKYWNGSHFECNTNKGIVVIHDVILYQLYHFGVAHDKYGCQSKIINNK